MDDDKNINQLNEEKKGSWNLYFKQRMSYIERERFVFKSYRNHMLKS